MNLAVADEPLENFRAPSSGDEYEKRTVWMCEPGSTTVHWRPTEQSLARESYNSIIKRNMYHDTNKSKVAEKFDVSEAMMRQTSMSRQAQMGPAWTPSGLLCRKIAENLTGEPVSFYPGSSRASTPSYTPQTGSRRGSGELTPRPPSCGQAPLRGGRARRNLRALGVVH